MRPACKWALYGAAHLLVNGAAVLIFRQYLNISWFSLLPVIYTVAFYFETRWPSCGRWQRMREQENQAMAGFAHIEKDRKGRIRAWGRRYVCKDGSSPAEGMELVYALAPFCLPFILFFPPVVKALYVLFPVLAPLVYAAALILRAKVKGELPPPAESEKAKQERERKEQQQREELGHWK